MPNGTPATRRGRRRVGIAMVLLMAACSDPATAPIEPPPPPPPPPPADTATTAPPLPREFRGLWVATVANIDWPSRAGLPITAQQAELITLLDRASAIGLNAVVLQVRAAGDALFPSTLEPWSRALSGTQGVDPGWDPLAFAVAETHARGLELHAWFNPFRAGNRADSLALAPQHLSRRRPDLTRDFCTQRWFDPGEPEVRAHALSVIADVVRRYDVDAVHLDDYFYPYPDSRCPGLAFPDSGSYARYLAGGGTLGRDDWRRDNVNRFVEALRPLVHGITPFVRVGISPFGIWRPGTPPGITGLDSYASIYADSQRWLTRGWVDYFAPQLYWARSSTGQRFTTLLDWWVSRNTMRRHLWPGLAAYRVADGTASAFTAEEIEGQLAEVRTRATAGPTAGHATGTILYNTSVLLQDRGGLATRLQSGAYAMRAAVPATPWLTTPEWSVGDARVSFAVGPTSGFLRLERTTTPADRVRWWLVRWRTEQGWTFRQYATSRDSVPWPTLATGRSAAHVTLEFLSPTGVSHGVVRLPATP